MTDRPRFLRENTDRKDRMTDLTNSPSTRDHHPATLAVLRYFTYEHLPLALQNVSRPFHDLAHSLASYLEGPELTVGLRKLLEAKDCAVRAALDGKEASRVGSQ